MIRLISQAHPLRWKIVITGKQQRQVRASSWPVAVVDRGFVGEPCSPPSISSRGHYQRVTGGKQCHVKSGTVTFRVHYASIGAVTENRLQSDVLLGPVQIVGCHNKLHWYCYVCGEVFGCLNEVRCPRNSEPVEESGGLKNVPCTNVDPDALECRVPGGRPNFVQEPIQTSKTWKDMERNSSSSWTRQAAAKCRWCVSV